MTQQLHREFEFYLAHQDEMVANYDGKVIAIKDGNVLGAFGTYIEAITKVEKDHPLGTFLLQRVSPGEEAYTATVHTPGVSPG